MLLIWHGQLTAVLAGRLGCAVAAKLRVSLQVSNSCVTDTVTCATMQAVMYHLTGGNAREMRKFGTGLLF